MLADLLYINRELRFGKTDHVSLKRSAISVMKSKHSQVKCDRGGCKNHSGRCAMDDAWEAAMESADNEFNDPEDAA